MGDMVNRAIDLSVEALRTRDLTLAREVIDDDQKINHGRFDIEEQCLLIIATQAPMASDLRMLAAALNITTDLERMAHHDAGIANIPIMIGNEALVKHL